MTDSQLDRTTVNSDAAPPPVGHYSHAVRHGDLLFCSGAIPLDPATNELVEGPVSAHARRCLENLAAVCEAAGGELADAVRMTVYATDLGDLPEINEAYVTFFPAEPPARVTIGVAALPKGAPVEIDAVIALR